LLLSNGWFQERIPA